MAPAATVLVATSDTERRNAFIAAAHAGGFEPLACANAEAVLRTAVGSDPDVVVIDAHLPGLEGFALHERLSRTGLELPPIVVVAADGAELPRTAPPLGVYVLSGADAAAGRVVEAVRLILLADDVDGQMSGGMKLLHGDLVRSPFPDLIRALHRHRVTGTVTVHGAQTSGFAVEDGAPVDAWRGPARGVKALCRLSELSAGAYSFVPGRLSDERTIGDAPGALLDAAAKDRRDLDEAMARLPSLDARLDVNLTPEFFAHAFTPIERSVLGTMHSVPTLRALFDAVEAVDGEIARTVVTLIDRELARVSPATGRVHVVTDGLCDLAPQDARRVGIEIAAGDDVGDAVPAAALEELYGRLIPSGDVLAVVSSSKLSGTYHNAVAATASAGDVLARARREAGSSADPRVLVVDSRQLSGPLAMTAVFATRMLASGMGLEAAARRIANLGGRWRTMLLLPAPHEVVAPRAETIEQSTTVVTGPTDRRWVASLEGGELRIDDSTELATARTVLADRLLGAVDRDRPVFVGLFYASAPAEVAALRTMLRARLRVAELWEFQMGPAVVALTGPGAVGAAVLQPDADELEMLTERG